VNDAESESVWPCEEEGERQPQPLGRWSADKSFELVFAEGAGEVEFEF
jgi:hypothetical protein